MSNYTVNDEIYFELINKQDINLKAEITQILKNANHEFIPPLSHRTSTRQLSFISQGKETEDVSGYEESLYNQILYGVFSNEKLVGLFSVIENYHANTDLDNGSPNVYLSTLIVDPSMRGKGIAKSIYRYLLDVKYSGISIMTRTWSTNEAHIALLNKLGFDQIKRIENDRGPGIDTAYFNHDPKTNI